MYNLFRIYNTLFKFYENPVAGEMSPAYQFGISRCGVFPITYLCFNFRV